MIINSIEDILPLVEKPSRYLGSEINSVRKKPEEIKLNIALAFPDLYEIGMSHFGLQILYDILNKKSFLVAERVYAPALDMENYLRSSNISLFSQESHKPIKDFNIIGFSLLYELNFTNILLMLELSSIPFYAAQRDETYPLIIAGGPCAVNPEPLADFFDAMVIGDGEEVILKISSTWIKWKESKNKKKECLLKMLSEIEGVYIPSFFKPSYITSIDTGGDTNIINTDTHDNIIFQTLTPVNQEYKKVKKAIVANLDFAPFPKFPVVAFGRPVHDRLRLEVARGCSRGCRFCQAGMIYRPVRERSVENLLKITKDSLITTGYEDISLLSLSTGDYGCISSLMENLMNKYASEHVSISLPSIRAGRLTPELMKLIKRVRKTGFTIAPEAGTQRLRDVINKGITEEEIISTVSNAFMLGWRVIKLYFMIGLPTETDEDLQGIVDLVNILRQIKGQKGHKEKINVSITTFIPKSHTPFQWSSQLTVEQSIEKISWLKEKLKFSNVQVKWQSPQTSFLEGLWARGDRRLSSLLVTAYKSGCRFDGWSDHFNFNLWKKAIEKEEINGNVIIHRKRKKDEVLPWDHIDVGISKKFLIDEYQKSENATLTNDCRFTECTGCGVCNFEEVKPVIFSEKKSENENENESKNEDKSENENKHEKVYPPGKKPKTTVNQNYKKVKLCYSKQDHAKYFGHLELVNIIQRAIRRAQIPVKYSEGFHPMMKTSFEDPLPLGIESLGENFYLTVQEHIKPSLIQEKLNLHLPSGLKIHSCVLSPKKSSKKIPTSKFYLIKLKNQEFNKDKLAQYQIDYESIICRKNKKGKVKKINLKEAVINIALQDDGALQLELNSEPGKAARPFEVLLKIFNLPEDVIKQACIVKFTSDCVPNNLIDNLF
ncbi:MAG: B12-binding domain-containing radical SAM protein [Desulfobacteraceae bacterium 4572_19]|nr:MAG: B12-binding domain-containing radical SAM protein [Desulfobacteraceae bacterium 4572_19]